MKDGLTQVKELKDKIHEQYIEIQELNKENDRLKNIINELEKYLNEQIQKSWEIEEQCYETIYSKLQELKGEKND